MSKTGLAIMSVVWVPETDAGTGLLTGDDACVADTSIWSARCDRAGRCSTARARQGRGTGQGRRRRRWALGRVDTGWEECTASAIATDTRFGSFRDGCDDRAGSYGLRAWRCRVR